MFVFTPVAFIIEANIEESVFCFHLFRALCDQIIGGSAGFWKMTGSHVAQGYSPSNPCSLSRAERTAAYKDFPDENSAKKYFKNS
jgi:hypothetical protein